MNRTSSTNSGCLGLLLSLLGLRTTKPPEDTQLPYRLRDDFLSAAEISFYHVLCKVVGEQITVCPKVGLGDVFFVSRPHENQGARNRIASKHVDYLLCDSATMRPLVGIELDDASHEREDRRERDALVEKVFAAAELPLVRFPVEQAYALAQVAERLAAILNAKAEMQAVYENTISVEGVVDEAATNGIPLCPKCEIPMWVRNGQRGKFYGCRNFPKCFQKAKIV